MPIQKLNIDEFLRFARTGPVLDVRSPGEYEHAHIPGAFSFPIFSNEERHVIGTAYKQESREKAIKLGLGYFGKDLVRRVEEAEKIMASVKSDTREIGVHCWRGGMRSAAMAWLLDLYGFKVYLLNGGYKAYRRWALEQFNRSYELRIIGGYTGGNKTGVIEELQKRKEPAIDLEALAVHKGSAFGNLDHLKQPSQEQFENLLAEALYHESAKGKPIWVEGESQRLGLINIPFSFYTNMRTQPVYFLDIPFEQRLAHITAQYSKHDREKLINAIVRIKKKLGGLEAKAAVNALMEDDIKESFSILLKYYDKLYLKSTYNKQDGERPIISVMCHTTDQKSNTEKLLQHVNT